MKQENNTDVPSITENRCRNKFENEERLSLIDSTVNDNLDKIDTDGLLNLVKNAGDGPRLSPLSEFKSEMIEADGVCKNDKIE